MGRLLDWPRDLRWVSREPLTGPRTIGSGSTQSATGFMQTFASPFGLWRWSFTFPPLRGPAFRAYRGAVTALHGGANAIRVPFCDPDGLTWPEIGVTVTPSQIRSGVPWSNGLPWSNGQNWSIGRPWVTLPADVAAGETIVPIGTNAWAAKADIGLMLGFAPFHLGVYIVTERLSGNRVRIWPPLRKALAAGSYATLEPVMAMRLEGESSAPVGRDASFANALSMTLVEVEDADTRTWFSESET
jgi:hypothetical protein